MSKTVKVRLWILDSAESYQGSGIRATLAIASRISSPVEQEHTFLMQRWLDCFITRQFQLH